jgi:hypothetical protein
MYIVKYPFFLSDFNKTWIISTDIWKTLKHQVPQKSFQWKPNCSMRTNGHRDTTQLIVSFRSFANTPETAENNCAGNCLWARRNSVVGISYFIMEVTSRSHNRDPEYFLLSAEETPQQIVVFFTLQISPPSPGSHEAHHTTRLIGGPNLCHYLKSWILLILKITCLLWVSILSI